MLDIVADASDVLPTHLCHTLNYKKETRKALRASVHAPLSRRIYLNVIIALQQNCHLHSNTYTWTQ